MSRTRRQAVRPATCARTRSRCSSSSVRRSGAVAAPAAAQDGDLDGAWYALAATDDPEVNAAIVAECTRHRVFCVRADIAKDGTAVTPATAHYDGLTLGVLAGGIAHLELQHVLGARAEVRIGLRDDALLGQHAAVGP